MMLTQERLKYLLIYDPETGVFTRRVKAARMAAGTIAGGLNRALGYVQIGVDGKREYAHRLAWLYMMGEFPETIIDHADQDGANNRWNNLRLATKAQNAANAKRRSDNTSGLKGVGWRGDTQKWTATVKDSDGKHALGCFDCPAAAHFAYIIGADRHFGKFARSA